MIKILKFLQNEFLGLPTSKLFETEVSDLNKIIVRELEYFLFMIYLNNISLMVEKMKNGIKFKKKLFFAQIRIICIFVE